MRAVVIDGYGDASALHPTEAPEPKLGPDFVLVRVRGAGVNPVDTKIRRGKQDAAFPVHFPAILGWDASGVVERVGPAVLDWRPGDEVIAYARKHHIGDGCYAEYVALPAPFLARAPSSVDAVTAGGLPLAALTAWQVLTEALDVRRRQTVLVHAAGGGVGSFAVQIAKWIGARVIGTGSAASFAYLRSLGVDECVDYHAGPVSKQVRDLMPEGVDAVLDLIGGSALADSPAALGEDGRLASVIDPAKVKELGGRYVFVRPDGGELARLAVLVDEGAVRINVADVLPLDQAAEAHRRLEEGHTKGKLVLAID